jgi:hypothetical protein
MSNVASLPDGKLIRLVDEDPAVSPDVVAEQALRLLCAWTQGKPEEVGGADHVLADQAVYVVRGLHRLAHGKSFAPSEPGE